MGRREPEGAVRPIKEKEGKENWEKSEGESGDEGGIGESEGETFEEWQLEGRVEKLEMERAEGNKDFVERKERN